MSIANELSSDVANAVMARNDEETSADSSELKDVVMKIHSTLRRLMTTETRQRSRRRLSSSEPEQAKSASSNQ